MNWNLLGITLLSFGWPIVVSAQQGPLNTRDPQITETALEAARSANALWEQFRADSAQLVRAGKNVESARRVIEEKVDSILSASGDPLAAQCLEDALDAPAYSFGCYWTSVRMNDPAEVDSYFGGLEVGNAFSLTLGSEKAALYTELLSDNIWIASWPGYARVGLSAQVAAADDSTNSTVAQFFQGGGNAVLYGAIPMMAYLNYLRDGPTPTLKRRIDLFATVALGADVPEMSSAASEMAGNFRIGLNGQGYAAAYQNVFRFFFQASGNYVVGLSDSFYENLTGLAEPEIGGGFLSGTLTVGVDLAELIRAGIRFNGASKSFVDQKPQFTIQLLPKN